MMIDTAALRSPALCRGGIHQSDLVIVKKSVEAQFAFSPDAGAQLSLSREAHKNVLSIVTRW